MGPRFDYDIPRAGQNRTSDGEFNQLMYKQPVLVTAVRVVGSH